MTLFRGAKRIRNIQVLMICDLLSMRKEILYLREKGIQRTVQMDTAYANTAETACTEYLKPC